MVFQMMFAIITVALISGAVSDRIEVRRLGALRVRLVHPGLRPGRALGLGRRLDRRQAPARSTSPVVPRCTSTPVRPRSVVALVLGKRIGWPRENMKPHNVPFVAARRRPAVVRLVRLQRRFRADRRRHHRVRVRQHPGRHRPPRCSAGSSWSGSGTASRPWSAPRPVRSPVWSPSPRPVASSPRCRPRCIGLIAGAVCALAVGLKYKLGYDDSLDVVGVHFVGGWIGSLSIGFFATAQVNAAIDGPRRQRGPASTAAA